jgi:hypothetical protein
VASVVSLNQEVLADEPPDTSSGNGTNGFVGQDGQYGPNSQSEDDNGITVNGPEMIRVIAIKLGKIISQNKLIQALVNIVSQILSVVFVDLCGPVNFITNVLDTVYDIIEV